MIKKIVFIITTYLFRILNPYVKVKKSIVFCSKMSCKKNNRVTFEKAEIKRSNIGVMGRNNVLEISSWQNRVRILCVGNNNVIRLGRCILSNTSIVLKGDNCVFQIGDDTTVLGATMVCMGHGNELLIGKDCMFSKNIEIWNTDSHQITDMMGNVINDSLPIHIGNHVWIGKNAFVLKGCDIGDNSVVGMGSMVTKDVLPNTIVAGIPAKTIKENILWNRKQMEQ